MESGSPAPNRGMHPSLRARLILTTLSVLVVIGVGIGLASVLTVRASLMGNLDEQLRTTAESAQHGPGGGARSDGAATGAETGAPAEYRRWLRFLDMPGQGDRTIALVTDGSTAIGAITRAEYGAPQSLDEADARSLIGLDADEAPRSITLPNLGSYRVMTFDQQGLRVTYGIPQDGVDSALRTTGAWTAGAVGIGLVAAGLAAGLVISRQLRPLRQVARTAREAAGLDLNPGGAAVDVRVPDALVKNGTEVGDVAAAMNAMLGNVDAALAARYRSEVQMRRFVADASHELRTPLTTIRGYADLTKPLRSQSPEQVAQALERIDAGAVRMSGLVDDLLLLARLDAGRERVQTTTVDLSELLIEMVGDAHATTADHDHSLDLPPEPVEALGDRARVAQIVANLLTNARVHTPRGTHITVSAEKVGESALIRVADDGPGIDPELGEKIFDRFARGDQQRARSNEAQVQGGSSGLGLAIVRSLARAMGGDVSVASSPAGSIFTVELPAARGFSQLWHRDDISTVQGR
ncbi:HAMP domain-containing histidine kinase [Brevibacterium sp. 91QC2O2]|uniref:sensor histidine kinase n=1 Tax=Brevibacterium sp. 91QC2O2 TaxID=2968458 RepID=UPI00211D154F|nr:HAMP domain-containing sensor histidine kinase [Brevibacterium sp. 91QC2O2]MCQ9369164.1 HAMP domain-containing histidine kinase [Brevibacterium sp. 91QC2O2]